MGTRVDQRSPSNYPPDLSPLGKLGWQIRITQYKPSARETEALSKCLEDVRWYNFNGALVSGAAAWISTGLGRKLNVIPRIFVTGVAAWIGRDLGGRVAGYSCMKRILSLDGSPLRAELMSILKEGYPDHPILRTDLGRIESSPLSGSLSNPQDYAQEAHAPVPLEERAFERNDSSSAKTGDWPEVLPRGTGNGQENRRVPRIWEINQRKQAMRQDDGADIVADPLDLLMPEGAAVDDFNDTGGKETGQVERRRSRMGTKERREYDRKRYEQRKQEQHHF